MNMFATYPFTVDRHLRARIDAKMIDLFDVLHVFHIRRVAARTKNDSDLRAWVNVVRRDERAGRVVYERGEFDREVLWWPMGTGGRMR